jgi:hypothetical protein
MNRRQGIIASLCGILPAFPAMGYRPQRKQDEPPKLDLGSVHAWTTTPVFLSLNGKFSVGWDHDTDDLIVKCDNREAKISAKEIMDALGGNPLA